MKAVEPKWERFGTLVTDEGVIKFIQGAICRLAGTRRPDFFPGAQPVSLAEESVGAFLREDYFVCEKSDGIRCLMFLCHLEKQAKTFLIDRKYSIRSVDL